MVVGNRVTLPRVISGMTPADAEAWFEIKHASKILCRAMIRAHKRGCGTLFGCDVATCDTLDLIESERSRIKAARRTLGV